MSFISHGRRRSLLNIRLPAIDTFDSASTLLLALLVVLALATFRQYAVSNDEGLQHHYGELIIAYYRSGFTDRSVFGFQNLYLYGGLFDIIAVLLSHLLPFDPYDIRHVMSALSGIAGIAATWATARMIAGPRAGFFAGLALALCGVWYGGMFNHTKDIPFAAAMMGATYYLLRAARDLPRPRWRDLIWFGVLLGAALGLRATGLLMLGYLALVLSAAAIGNAIRARGGKSHAAALVGSPSHSKSDLSDFDRYSCRAQVDPTSGGEGLGVGVALSGFLQQQIPPSAALPHISAFTRVLRRAMRGGSAPRSWLAILPDFPGVNLRMVTRFIPALALAYVIMNASWPWASLAFLNPVRAIFAFAEFHYPVRTLLAGQVYLMSDVPRWYEPDYLAIKMPMVVLIGAAAALIATAWTALVNGGKNLARAHAAEIAFLGFTIVFPLACQIIGHGPSFTGMRHFLFVVPPLTALAGIGVDAGLAVIAPRSRLLHAAALVGVLAAFGQDALALERLHPYEYLFYNSFVGGLKGAGRRYDTDYWVNIMPAAVKHLEAHLDELDRQAGRKVPRHYTVGVCGERVSFENEADRRLQWTPDWDHADFFIAPTQMNCDEVLRGRVVDQIKRVGVLIGVVKDLRGLSPQARWAPVEVAHAPASNGAAPTTPHG
ncbi:MAG TPA: glycosyltransferase family 39 protein [Xanthobacteraceae bacterium]|nr:glycosyltransferase family 39 protein [Xanthobacteraceae bacterium]